jgi:molybdopterin converting factor small subunit
MKIELLSFGIARDIIGASKTTIDLHGSVSIADLKKALESRYPEFTALASLKFAVGEEYRNDSYDLKEGQEVVIIPPVSGG